MATTLKRILNLFFVLLSCALIIYSIYSMLSNSKRDLTQVDSFEGKITEKGIAENPAPNISVTKVFFFKLEGLDQMFATYNPKQDYAALDSALGVGDHVKVYFKRISFPEVPNLNAYQVEKDGRIIIGEGDIKNKELKGGILSVLLVVLILIIGYWRDRKIRRSAPSIGT
jgi:hypothetical protein